PRKETTPSGRSINLALSARGISALAAVGAAETILSSAIPMKGRLIHGLDGSLSSQPYGVFGECINSIDRKLLNEHLITSVEELPNAEMHFEHELKECDFDRKEAVFIKKDGSTTTISADLIVGADGAYSTVRHQLMRRARISYSQEYIDHGWVELTIPPKDGEYAMDPNHLHIWPRQTFMLIALPNIDKSFTVTLFMPWEKFDSIHTETDLVRFFEETFPDALELMGYNLLVGEYFKNVKGNLISIKCSPYHFQDRCVLVGDAAHAMVPFYGQGMNCGFEDIQLLDEILTAHLRTSNSKHPSPIILAAALQFYSLTRSKNVTTMNDLAMHNYIEMRSSVTSWRYLLRKKVEGCVHWMFPRHVIPLYTMVSFTNIPYAEVKRRWERQSKMFKCAGWVVAGLGTAAATYGLLRYGGARVLGLLKWKHYYAIAAPAVTSAAPVEVKKVLSGVDVINGVWGALGSTWDVVKDACDVGNIQRGAASVWDKMRWENLGWK
ncbi:hypothetical protein HK104_003551, partial [Borealophlyctis nickersoniae]